MPRTLDTRGNASLAIAVCDRCKMKRAYVSLSQDSNFPGLRVCDQGCKDQLDPYRLPARKTENISLRFPRPDVSVATDPNQITATGYGGYVLTTQTSSSDPAQNGNTDELTVTP